jgi:hypothetical protein
MNTAGKKSKKAKTTKSEKAKGAGNASVFGGKT